ncbi:ABC transporter substrate-binding protein [Viridibacillus sp. FSL R5-0477]|uniref:Iron ABC transporter substrate-binding protein n=1 Tax=Viridibacillus arenosi FSL R5-213 TaxID=1227360 RepID=W4F7K7_9BACL|nr:MULTISPECIES: ABC transporter substrate-binding protein [Viridibacillus]ETT88071.1 iron ABC transporter substrate-binding protein [Viridibacillus arenosi FSL R5-213]OMC82782.1 ABC transporter substrate-binding protein [Viridibacillus sp. FSL H7-0596]OMC88102.1 ABC transporter substrate-binding protein [Viridibacillus arenosi]
MKKRSLKMIATVGTLLTLALAGCGNSDTATNDGEASAQSKENKTLTVYSAGPDGLAANVQQAFEEKTGMKVEMFQGTTGKILSRLEAEKTNPVADVVVLASVASMDGMKEANQLQSYKDAENAGKINSDWSDAEGYYYGYSASALGIAYNTKNAKSAPSEWSDLAKAEWKDKINIPDPSLSGSAVDFIYGYTEAEKTGWDIVQSWKTNGLQVNGANKEALDSVITGDKDATISGVDYMAYKAKADGEPVEIVYPKSGTVVSPRAVGIMKDAKNVDGAQAYVNFLLSDEGQKLVTDAYLLPGNKEIPVKDRAALDEIPQLTVNWKGAETKQIDILTKFNEIFQ